MTVEAMRALKKAWEEWDARSSAEAEARTMEVACETVAAELDLSISDLRDTMSAGRRQYLHRSRIVKLLYGLEPDVVLDESSS
jgi:hypothetical protein